MLNIPYQISDPLPIETISKTQHNTNQNKFQTPFILHLQGCPRAARQRKRVSCGGRKGIEIGNEIVRMFREK